MTSPLRRLWRWIAGSFAALVILLAVALGLFRLLLPQIPAYHAQIESWASAAVGLPVRLGKLDARWSFGGPELTFTRARLFTRDSDEVLIEAAEGSVGINLGELLRGGKVRPGKVVLEGTRLSLERSEEGILHLTGQTPPAAGAKRAMAPVLQVLPRGNFEVRDAAILYVDHGAGYGPWRFSDVDLAIAHGRAQLLIEGSARLPASLGEYAEFKFSTRDPLVKPLAIRWQGAVNLDAINLDGIGELLPDKMPEVQSGSADLSANFGMIGGQLQHVTANLTARNFTFANEADGLQGWNQFGGLFEFDREASGWKVQASRLVIERDGNNWPETRMTFERTASSDKSVEIIYLDVGYLRLDDLQPIVAWLPAGELRSTLTALAPAGELRNVVINRSLRDGETVSFALRGEFTDLAVAAHGAMPGASGLDGKLRMDDAGGLLEFDSSAASLELPSFYDEPLPLTGLRAGFNWQKQAGGWLLNSESLEIDTPAFGFAGDLQLELPANDESPVIDLTATIENLDLERGRVFLPVNKLPPGAYRWLYGALVSGQAPTTSVLFKGPLRAYPFANDEGQFRIRTIIEDMRFAFARNWPAIDDARIEAVIENASYRGRIISGKIAGNDVAGSTATIDDFADPVLIMNGQARGTIPDLLEFISSSPVAKVFGPRLADFESAGSAQTEVVLNLPLTRMKEFRLNGNTEIQAEWLGLRGLEQRFTEVDGDINFTEKAARANDIQAELFGRAVTIDVRPGSNAQGEIVSTLVEVEGQHSAINLVNNLPFPVATVMEGEMSWQATALFPRAAGGTEQQFGITVTSNLEGMEILLPEPAFKPAGEQRRLVAEFAFPAEGTIAMQVDYGGLLTSATRFTKTPERWRHERSSIALGGAAASLPATEGLVVTGAADLLALDDWIAVDWGEPEAPDQPPLLRSVNLQVGRVLAYGQTINDAVIKLDRNAREWLAQVNSARVEGSLLIPEDLDSGEPIFADLVRLVLLPDESETVDDGSDPRDLPAMRLSAAEFIYDDMNFGSLEAQISKSPYGLVADMIKTRDPGFVIDGSGSWEVLEGEQRSQLDLELQATDVRRTLMQLGFDPLLKADQGTVSASLNWPGAPDRNFRQKLAGTVSVRVGDGQLLEVEPGAGRMFGLLSIAALPRRLSLDFRDVFDSGFGFDSISGDFEIQDGQAYTNNLVLDGPAADIGIAGRAGLVDRDYDQTAVVRANFGSALPVAGAIAAGPAVGAALLIFSEILKDPLKDMSKVFYRVSGSWDEPEILRVNQAVADGPGSPTQPPPALPETDGG